MAVLNPIHLLNKSLPLRLVINHLPRTEEQSEDEAVEVSKELPKPKHQELKSHNEEEKVPEPIAAAEEEKLLVVLNEEEDVVELRRRK